MNAKKIITFVGRILFAPVHAIHYIAQLIVGAQPTKFRKGFFGIVAYVGIPIAIMGIVGSIAIAMDQALYLRAPAMVFAQSSAKDIALEKKGVGLFQSATRQLKYEMDVFPWWSANDPFFMPQGWWDNPRNRKEGVWYATSQAVDMLSDRITRYGTGQPENLFTLTARKKINIGPNEWKWGVTTSEGYFEAALQLIEKYEKCALQKKCMVDIRSDDLEYILRGIKDRVLAEPYGRLTARNSTQPFDKLDDVVMFAVGSARVARDILVAMRYFFHDELDRGGIENMDAAIDSLNAASEFHPWWVARGDRDSMWADHRAKLSRYYTEAFRRIENLADSLRT